MARMFPEAYSWWPWRVWAAATACASGGAALAVLWLNDRSQGRDPELVAAVAALAVYGAGNGLLLGSAIGDMGRTLLAVVLAAFAATLCMEYLGMAVYILGLPIVVAALSASLSRETGVHELVRNVLGGWLMLAICLPLGLCGMGILAALSQAGSPGPIRIALSALSAFAALAAANVLFIGLLFRSMHRVTRMAASAAPRTPVEPGARSVELSRLAQSHVALRKLPLTLSLPRPRVPIALSPLLSANWANRNPLRAYLKRRGPRRLVRK